jgi:hypothetical protein
MGKYPLSTWHYSNITEAILAFFVVFLHPAYRYYLKNTKS